MLVLLINKHINKEDPIDGKRWDKGITIAQVIPLEYKDNIEWKVQSKCKIEDNARIFFKA